MDRDLKDKTTTVEALDFKSIEDWRQVHNLELDVYGCTNYSLNMPHCSRSLRSIRVRCKTLINASEYVSNASRRVLTSLLLSSAKWLGVGGGYP